ncbi:MAG: hypothetical protein R3E70_02695 [Burkholderiaceae bacterium]
MLNDTTVRAEPFGRLWTGLSKPWRVAASVFNEIVVFPRCDGRSPKSVVFLVALEAGMCARRRTYFLLLRQRK